MKTKIAKIGEKFGEYVCISEDYTLKKDGHVNTVVQRFACSCGTEKDLATKQLRYYAKLGKTPRCISCSRKETFLRSSNIQESFRARREAAKVGLLSGTFYSHIKQCALARGLSFELSREFLWELIKSQEFRCALSGVEIVLSLERKKSDPNFDIITASLDRKDSLLGYLPNNVQWVHKKVNRMKSDMPEEEFFRLCSLITSHRKIPSQAEGMS